MSRRHDTVLQPRRVAPRGTLAPTRDTRERVRPRRRARRLTKWLIGLGVMVTVVTFATQWLLRQPYFRVQHVTFIGLRHESASAVLAASGLSSHPSMINLSDATIEKNLASFTWINSLVIQKHWPNSVVVTVHESVAVAVAYTSAHGLDFVNEAGRALGPAPADANLPTLQYLHPTTSTWPYERSGRGAALVASELPRAFETQVSSISEDASASVSIKLTTPVTFILGPATNLHAKFVAIASVIAHSTLVPGDVVNVTVPDELAVTPPAS